MTGIWKALVLGMSALALIGAKAAPVGDVVPLPETVMPDSKHPIGQPFDAMPGDIVLSGRIVRTEAAVVEGPAKVEVDRFSDTISAGDELTSVLLTPEMTKTLGVTRMYCGRDQRTRSAFAQMMIGNIGSKFREIVRFCFLDVDGSGKFQQYLLAGARDKTLQAPKPIEPLPYHMDRLRTMHEDDLVRVRYKKYVSETNKVELEVEVVREGKKTVFSYILWARGRSPVPEKLYPRLTTDPTKIPYPVYFNNVIGASIAVKAVTPEGKASFAIERDFALTLFHPVLLQVRYIYIYY